MLYIHLELVNQNFYDFNNFVFTFSMLGSLIMLTINNKIVVKKKKSSKNLKILQKTMRLIYTLKFVTK